MKEEYSNDFYEDAGDLLSGFRKRYGGGLIGKDGADPFAKDVDSIQNEHEEKLRTSQSNMASY